MKRTFSDAQLYDGEARPNIAILPESPYSDAENDPCTSLCDECSVIDFKAIFSRVNHDFGKAGEKVTEHRTTFDPTCAFCQLVLSFGLPKHEEKSSEDIFTLGYHLRAFDSLKVLRLSRLAVRVRQRRSVVLVVVAGPDIDFHEDAQELLNSSISKGVIVPTTSSHESSEAHVPVGAFKYYGRRIAADSVDLSSVSLLVQECELSHGRNHLRCHSVPREALSDIFVIDCHTRHLVKLEKGTKYLALSYVWGSSTTTKASEHSQMELPKKLDFRFPRTVEDAVTVTIGLGQRYLWVDRYCITACAEKHTQIQNMGLVYEAALATIVAVTGQDSDSGLPGISFSRLPQRLVRTGTGVLTSTGRHISYHISDSKWYTRGWTYQEAILSRRCLFCTNEQVFFACKTVLRSEIVRQSTFSSNEPGQQKLEPSLMVVRDQIHHRNYACDSEPSFEKHLEQYTKRALSFQVDNLTAFKGILARLPFPSFWGIPFLKSTALTISGEVNRAYLRGLAWKCGATRPGETSTYRHSAFPTWCWASLNGSVESFELLSHLLHPVHFYPNKSYDSEIAFQGPDGKMTSLYDFYRCQSLDGLIFKEIYFHLYITGYVAKIRMKPTDQERIYLYELSEPFRSATEPHCKPCGFLRYPDGFQVFMDESNTRVSRKKLLEKEWDILHLYETFWLVIECRRGINYRKGIMECKGFEWGGCKLRTIKLA